MQACEKKSLNERHKKYDQIENHASIFGSKPSVIESCVTETAWKFWTSATGACAEASLFANTPYTVPLNIFFKNLCLKNL